MSDGSRIYFPLRSNAAALIAGQGVASVRRRLQVAALLHDTVSIEGGLLHVRAGPTGSWSFWRPPAPRDPPRWDSARHRGRAVGGQFYVAMRPSSAPDSAPFHRMIQSEAAIAWSATFEPFRDELPRGAAKYIEFGHIDDPPAVKSLAASWDSSAAHDGDLREHWPDQFVRDIHIKGTHLDLALSAGLGAAVSTDGAHWPVVAARARAGEAEPVLGHRTIQLFLPPNFSWSDVADLRRHRALSEYRTILRDVEEAALTFASSPADLGRALREAYWDRVARAEAQRPAGWVRVAVGGVGLLVGEAAGLAMAGVPLVGGSVGTVAGALAGELTDRLSRPHWLAIHTRLRRSPGPPPSPSRTMGS